jgi:hypothetical protein
MHCLGACVARRRDDRINIEVALRRWRRTDANGLVGSRNKRQIAVGIRVDGDALDPELATGADDAERNLSSIRDEQPLKHCC